MTKDLNALADRCEREEPSRELDGEIMFTLFAQPAGKTGYLWPEDNPSWSFAIRFPGRDLAWFKSVRRRDLDKETILVWRDGDPILMNDLRVPKLTTSLDAAVTLVPGLARWSMEQRDRFMAVVHDRTALFKGDRYEATGASHIPALALCAAALRARASLASV